MKNLRISSLILSVAVTLFYLPSQAFFVEPILGYSIGKVTDDANTDQDHKGPFLGARLGMGIPVVPMLWAALDGGITTGGKYSDADLDADALRVGLSVGIDIPLVPILDRVWAGYNVIDNLSFDADDSKLKGNSFKVGVGLKFVPFVSLNFEYFKGNYSKTEASGTETDSDNDFNGFIASVSLPLP